MIFIIFFIAAILVVTAAIHLNHCGDVISKKTSLSGAVVGTFLIAGATSLPELTTSMTAVYIDNPDIAVGNMLGSNVFNLLILAVVDLFYRKQRLFQRINQHANLPSAWISLAFLIIISLSLLVPESIQLFNIGIEMYVIVIFYIFSMKFIASDYEDDDGSPLTKDIPLSSAIKGFLIAVVVVFVSGSILSIAGDHMAEITGMNASFVGSFLIAASTSLPEFVSVLAAFKLANYNMAVGSIIGSNLYNLKLLVFTDLLYRKGAILNSIQGTHLYVAILGITMTLFLIYTLKRPNRIDRLGHYLMPSLFIITLYFVTSYMIFFK
ncbi:sodium:calcium antiporter [Halobacillus sp. Nhm2S1]|uniref:sodium:calcium antiporter n=1 Tax=Halobacillus sp. Nhm2S1 TaxID=2866716 RepID=UPI001C73DA83|nr:sodium:calcium antiporter [Halobacillus sp. Nhm2S1]MBX0356109.1 sodium:calcium antiporter [Halobacillus sp. Nhm2S1]